MGEIQYVSIESSITTTENNGEPVFKQVMKSLKQM
ncbi:hypothetical protein SAMN05216225_10511 [Ornithinibacillus halophilus]|uniref:Uncharacterized protein n=1 Tax=Ornithinibacillus halophilus TaxID=930117 RepID=A0A1M5LW80_9BACI|nr:hypothetical protein SAMN05216225_10511 [Ornithinibacillus halophilus]